MVINPITRMKLHKKLKENFITLSFLEEHIDKLIEKCNNAKGLEDKEEIYKVEEYFIKLHSELVNQDTKILSDLYNL